MACISRLLPKQGWLLMEAGMLVKEQEQWHPAWSRGTWSNLAPGLWQQQSSVSNVLVPQNLKGWDAARRHGS